MKTIRVSKMTQSDEINLFNLLEERRKESKQEHLLLHERISNMRDDLIKELKEINASQMQINDSIDNRLTALERYMWLVIGGGSVSLFFVLGIKDILLNFLG